MPVTQRRNRKQLRHSVGLLLGALRQESGQAESSPTETSPNAVKLIDNSLSLGAENEHRGRWVYATDSAGSAQVRRIINSSRDDRSLTVSIPFASVPGSSWSYELWDADIPPSTVHEFLGQAISAVTRKGSIGTVDETFHTGRGVNSFDLPDDWTGVRDLSWRSGFYGLQLAGLDTPPGILSSNASISVDSAEFREGSGSALIDVAPAASSGEALAEVSFSPLEARAFDCVELWHRSSVDHTSSSLVVQLRQGSSTHESLPVPATVANRWNYLSLSVTSPEQNGALDALRIVNGSSDAGAATHWFDDVRLTRANSETWHRVPREFWDVSAEKRQISLDQSARFPYSRLRLTGVRAPAQLQTDSQVCEVGAQYVINAAAAGLLRSRGDRRGSVRDVSLQQADLYEQKAQALRLRMNTPANIRWVDD